MSSDWFVCASPLYLFSSSSSTSHSDQPTQVKKVDPKMTCRMIEIVYLRQESLSNSAPHKGVSVFDEKTDLINQAQSI